MHFPGRFIRLPSSCYLYLDPSTSWITTKLFFPCQFWFTVKNEQTMMTGKYNTNERCLKEPIRFTSGTKLSGVFLICWMRKLTFLNVGTRVHSFIFLQEFMVTSEACCGCCRLRYSEIISVSFVFNVFCWYGVCWCATGVFFLPYWLQITLFLLNTPININNQPNHWSKFTSASLKSLTHTPRVTKSDHDRGSWCSGWWAGHLPIKSLVEQSPPPSVHVLKHHWVRYSTLISPESFLR